MQDAVRRRAALARALKALRRRRGATAGEVAQAIGMPLRSFEYFEAGGGRINVDRVHQAAEALNADPFAIFAAIELDAPEFAVHCADNKLMTILLLALRDFEASCGDAIVQLDPRTLMAAFKHTFEELARQAEDRAKLAAVRLRSDDPDNT